MHIGKRADSLEMCRLGGPAVGTALVYEFPDLDLGFCNWFGLCAGIGISVFLCFWTGTQVFFIFGDESCASTHVL